MYISIYTLRMWHQMKLNKMRLSNCLITSEICALLKLNMTEKYFQFVDTQTFLSLVLSSVPPLSLSLSLSLYTYYVYSVHFVTCFWLPMGNFLTENKSFWSSECKTFKWRTFFSPVLLLLLLITPLPSTL